MLKYYPKKLGRATKGCEYILVIISFTKIRAPIAEEQLHVISNVSVIHVLYIHIFNDISLENVVNCAYAKSPSLEGSNEGDLPHFGFQRLTCMLTVAIEDAGSIQIIT